MTGYRVAVDVGGTFTDLVVSAPELGDRIYKVSSTPEDPAVGVITGFETVAADLAIEVGELLDGMPVLMHGTTITTNALLTANGAKTGLIATDGFGDVLALRQGHRENQWDSTAAPPPHLVPRQLVQTVAGRIDRTGTETTPLREEAVIEAARRFAAEGVDAVAVSLLFSFLNPAHEQRVGELLEAELPEVFVSLSSDVAPHVRLYERTSTTVVNAYVGPILRAYLADLHRRLRGLGYRGSVQMMQSNGGLAAASAVTRHAVTTLLSGPAGGPVSSAKAVAPIDIPKTMTIDMGGTSFEASLARGGETRIRVDGSLGGYAITTPALDISTIGAGGGSIAWVDAGGMLRVGPQSAGAQPGPACYGRGGDSATVTDANVVLGYVGTGSFGSGELTLDAAAAERAVGVIAAQLQIDLHRAAAGIVTTINAAMADSLRLMTLSRGLDPREFALVAAGGAGPVHAAALAEDLEIPLVVIPRHASVLCAAGIQATDFRHYFVRTLFGRSLEPDQVERLFCDLEDEAGAQLSEEGASGSTISMRRVVEVRYLGQVHTIELPLPDGAISADTIGSLEKDFHPAHHRRFGHSLLDNEIELVSARLEARGAAWEPLEPEPLAHSGEEPVPEASRPAWFNGGIVEAPVYAVRSLRPGARIAGPALIELETSTVIVPPGQELEVHESGALLLHPSSATVGSVVERLFAGGVSV